MTHQPDAERREAPEAIREQITLLVAKWQRYRNQWPRSFNGEAADPRAVERENTLIDAMLDDVAALTLSADPHKERWQQVLSKAESLHVAARLAIHLWKGSLPARPDGASERQDWLNARQCSDQIDAAYRGLVEILLPAARNPADPS